MPLCTYRTVDPEAAVIDHAKQHLARFKVPKRVVLLDASELPMTATGKVQKFRLVEHLQCEGVAE